jgi:hypothetical protein
MRMYIDRNTWVSKGLWFINEVGLFMKLRKLSFNKYIEVLMMILLILFWNIMYLILKLLLTIFWYIHFLGFEKRFL